MRRFVFSDNGSDYMQLLNRKGQPSQFNGRLHYILTLVSKSLNGQAPEYITSMFSLKTHSINLRTLSYYGSKLWNSLPNATRSLLTVAAFKLAIRDLEFDTDCCPFCK